MKSICFRERMVGTWLGWSGAGEADQSLEPQSFEFEVEARGFDLPRLARDGRFQIRGTVWADGLADGTDLWGVLELHVRERQEIVYAFYFRDDSGAQWFFRGRKILSVWRPAKSMTRLHGTLYLRGTPKGRAELSFPWTSLPHWLASFEIVDTPGSPSSDDELDQMMADNPDLSMCSTKEENDGKFKIE